MPRRMIHPLIHPRRRSRKAGFEIREGSEGRVRRGASTGKRRLVAAPARWRIAESSGRRWTSQLGDRPPAHPPAGMLHKNRRRAAGNLGTFCARFTSIGPLGEKRVADHISATDLGSVIWSLFENGSDPLRTSPFTGHFRLAGKG